MKKGDFTLPGEAGYEGLTLKLAEKWGADAIRDSDGTELSQSLLDAGYEIYSTICCIRGHDQWAKEHPDRLQQTFLMSDPVIAQEGTVHIHLLKGYFKEQFKINDSDESRSLWQVFDRTAEREVPRRNWTYEPATGTVVVDGARTYHQYTVDFLAYRIWEEISMYNHVTNHWTSEHLMPIDPRYPQTQQYLLKWMDAWCQGHPNTDIVRFTSLFYNFAWIWGDDEKERDRFTDWGSYDFSVSPLALKEFENKYGYALSAEDFIAHGRRHPAHRPPNKKQRDYMDLTIDFVMGFGRKLVDIVHRYGKRALLFYDDSWIGTEPNDGRFLTMGFDGIIKCVFSGFEVRLCANVQAPVHEIRLHPYLFPTGLGGKPTFSKDGAPEKDAERYWLHIRRALLRQSVDRIGLGGYLHLVEQYPAFADRIEQIADEFREIKALHEQGQVHTLPIRVAVLHAWGKMRPWTLSGHFHETYMHDLIHINEALAGLPLQVSFLDFDDVKKGGLDHFDVVINAGRAGTAWSGADAWKNPELISLLTEWTEKGGVFIGVNEPSAVEYGISFFQMAHVLGVDEDTGTRCCEGNYDFKTEPVPGLIPEGSYIKAPFERLLVDGKDTRVVQAQMVEKAGHLALEPTLLFHPFGKDMGVYLSSFCFSYLNARMLLNIILFATGNEGNASFLTDDPWCECAYFPSSRTLIVINDSEQERTVRVRLGQGLEQDHVKVELMPQQMRVVSLADEKQAE